MRAPVTADDFGLTVESTKTIFDLVQAKRIDHVSLLVNAPETKRAIALIRRYRLPNIGLHFNLIEGGPLSEPGRIPSLVDEKGRFHPLPVFLLKLLLRRINMDEVKTELHAQLSVFRKNAIPCAFINSHQNTHYFPPVESIVFDAAKKYKIPFVRNRGSILKRLRRFPLKYAVFTGGILLLRLVYGKTGSTYPGFEEDIVHPGTDYD